MSENRITAQNPVRDLGRLDHERCAALHNLIIQRGWQDSGRHLSDLDQSSWWQLYSSQIDTTQLDPDLTSFLQSAQHGHNLASPRHNFHRYLASLTVPDLLIMPNAMYGPDEDDSNKRRFITLYQANPELGSSHPLGIIYDQDEHRAMMHMSMDDGMITRNGRQQWVRLEEILEALLQMMDEGKVQAVSSDEYEEDGNQERIEPWIMPSFTERDLSDSLHAWDELVTQIEAKMDLPPASLASDGRTLFEEVVPDGDMLPQESFAQRFLTSARRPRFTYIAPGLRLARAQPFADVPIDDDIDGHLRPVLLFQNNQIAHQDVDRAPWGQMLPRPAFYPHFQRAVSQVPAGLYLTESEPRGPKPFEDGVKLLLPHTIGGAGYARNSDGSLLGEDRIHHGPTSRTNTPRSSELYQSGYNPFIGAHDVQLKRVLRHWAHMVESGKWTIGEDGVQGGIDKWREADTADHWQDYVLPRTW